MGAAHRASRLARLPMADRRGPSARLALGALLLVLALGCEAPAAGSRPEGGAAAPGDARASAASPPPARLRIALATISESVAPVVVAQEAGFTARQGLDVEIIAARSGAEAMAALLSQDVPLGAIGGNAIINASASGADLVMVALLQPRLTYQVLAAPEVHEVRDLRGKRLG